MTSTISEIGHGYGRLVVVERADNAAQGYARWFCVCDCGARTVVSGANLRSGNSRSCGCLRLEAAKRTGEINSKPRTHGHCMDRRHSPTYNTWSCMIQRCTDENQRAWPNYGGRGIGVCERWRNSFEMFLADMGERPRGRTIHRVDNNGDYEPGNCEWATRLEQNAGRNRRTRKHGGMTGGGYRQSAI